MKAAQRPSRSSLFNPSLWSFCLRSMFKEYGNAFLLKVVLPHPIKTLKGMKAYSRASDRYPTSPSVVSPKVAEPIWTGGTGSFVGIGFCAKPLDPICISGRANHDCDYFEHRLHLGQNPYPESCQNCLIREIGTEALASKSDFYIMTSARDILDDLFTPALHSDRYSRALLSLCHYSFEPFKIALFITGIEAFLFPFEKGDCEDYRTWRHADKGIKDTQTGLRDHDLESIKTLLQSSGMESDPVFKYTKIGNIFQFDA